MEIYCIKEVEQNPLPKSQTKPFYIGTKEAPSGFELVCKGVSTMLNAVRDSMISRSEAQNGVLRNYTTCAIHKMAYREE